MNAHVLPFLRRLPCSCVIVAATLVPVAHADPGPAEDAWRVQATPYAWLSGLDGTVKPFRSAPSVHVSKSGSELLENLDAAAFLTASARRGSFVMQGDLTHASTSDSAGLPFGLTARAKVRQTSVTLTAGRTVAPSEQARVDLMAGLRYWDINAAVSVPGVVAARSGSRFVDPVAAVRWRHALGPRWSSIVHGDVGGFGVGSKVTWQAMALGNYQATDRLFVSVGYRHLSLDYTDDGRRLDFALSGPLAGLTYVF